MERKGSTASSGIWVDREIVQTDEYPNGETTASYPPSIVSIVRSMSDVRREAKTPEPITDTSKENPLRLNHVARHPDVKEERLGNLLDERRNDENLQYLIEFLNETPPATNYMSIPDYITSSSEDDRWTNLKFFRKKRRRRRKRRPTVITLPDSAVAAKTIGGYRHIAISIPFEHSHFGPLSASQYPIFDSIERDFNREIETRMGPLRTYTSDRGVVTVLKPVAEDRESLSSSADLASLSRKASKHFTSISLQRGDRATSLRDVTRPITERPRSELLTIHVAKRANTKQRTTLESPPRSVAKKRPVFIGITQPRVEPTASSVVQKVHSQNTAFVPNISSTQSTMPHNKLSLPSRKSSKKASIASADSIDGILSQTESPSRNGKDENVRSKRISMTESVTTSGSEPRLLDAQTARAISNISIVVRPPSQKISSIDSRWNVESPDSKTSYKVNRSVQTEPLSSYHTFDGVQSRKDLVREKKKRDLLVSQAKAPKQFSVPPTPQYGMVDTGPESPILGEPRDHRRSHASSRASSLMSRRNRPDLALIRVMAESGIPKIRPAVIPAHQERRSRSRSRLAPPNSPNSTPSSSPGSLTMSFERTSIPRRKEQRAELGAQKSHTARFAAAKALVEERETMERLSRQELLDRYEKLKEMRVHELEKRLRRLERNSEMWMQSMVPLMQSLNRLLDTNMQLTINNRDLNNDYFSHLRRARSQDRGSDEHQRPHTATGENRRKPRPQSLVPTGERIHGAVGVSRTMMDHRHAPSPLQGEFEKELAMRRRARVRGENSDNRNREKVQLSPDSESDRSNFTASSTTSIASTSATGFETLEPLMRKMTSGLRGLQR